MMGRRHLITCPLFITLYILTCRVSSELVFVVEPQTTALLLGENLRLDCVGNRTDAPYYDILYSWYLNGTFINAGSASTRTSLFANNSLWVPSVRASDLGDYTCKIKKSEVVNDAGKESAPAQVITAYIEEFYIMPQTVSAMEDLSKTGMFQCVSGYSAPPAELWWERDGVRFNSEVINTNLNFGLPRYGGAQRRIVHIEVKLLKVNDGVYRCVAKNPVSLEVVRSDVALLNITVPESAPIVEVHPPPSVIAAEGQPYLLPCYIVGNPTPVVTWLKNGNVVTYSGVLKQTANQSLQFLNLQQSNGGDYVCRGVNSLGTNISNPCKLQVASLGNTFVEQPQDTTAVAGSPATMRCRAPPSTPQAATILWYKDNNMFVTRSGIYSAQILSSGDLHFSNIQLGDAGSYFCVAENGYSIPNSRSSSFATLTVSGAPIFTEHPLPTRVIKDHLLTMTCRVAGQPLPTVRWYRNTGTQTLEITTSDPRVNFQESRQQLIMANMNKGDEGFYKCTATNQYRTSTSPEVSVFVIVPPEIISSVGIVTGIAGNRVMIPCGVYGDPTPSVIWQKDSVTINEGSNRRFISNGLEIVSATTADEGDYKCYATNEGGTATSQGTLTIQVSPGFTSTPEDKTLNRTDRLVIECKATGVPLPDIAWTFNDSSLPIDAMLSSDRTVMTIGSVQPTHAGRYTCRATNDVSTIVASGVIKVQVPPHISSIDGQKIIGEGSNMVLTCMVTGNPTPVITWLRDGQTVSPDPERRITLPSQTVLRISYIRKSDAGQFTCSAVNAAGVASLIVDIFVRDPPKPPILYDVKPMSTSSVNVSWLIAQQEPNNNATSFVLQYKEVLVPSYSLFPHEILPDVTSFELSGLKPAQAYHVRIAAKNEIGVGKYSGPKLVTTFETAPSEPRNFQVVSLLATKISLSWEIPAVKNGDIRKYQLHYRRTDIGGDYTVIAINNPDIPTHTTAIDNLHPYRPYDFRVRGATVEQDVSLWGNFTAVKRIQTLMDVPSASPTSVQLSVLSSDSIRATWQFIPYEFENGPTQGYLIYYKRNDSSEAYKILNTTEDQLSVDIQNLLPWRSYTVQVTGFNAIGESPRSVSMVTRTSPQIPSGAPENIQAVAQSSSKILVTWEDVDDEEKNGEIGGYRLHIGTTGENNFRIIPVMGAATRSQSISGLNAYTTYTIRLQAYTNQLSPGNGRLSDPITVRTMEDRPGPVKNVVITVLQNAVKLQWSPPDEPRGVITMYIISYETVRKVPQTSPASIDQNTTVATVAPYPFINNTLLTPNTEITVGGLYPGSEYSFSIVGETKGGVGLTPMVVNAETPDGPLPTSVTTTIETTSTSVTENATVVPTRPPVESTTTPPTTTAREETLTAAPPLPFLLQPVNLPILISICIVSGLLLFIILLIIVCCCVQKLREKERKEKAQRYFVPPSTSTRMASAGGATLSDVSEPDRKAAVLDIVEVQSTDLDYDPNPYSMDTQNTFKINGVPNESPYSVGSGTPNTPGSSGVNRSVSDPSYAKVKKSKPRDPIYDNAYTSMDELNLHHIPENQLKHIEHPYQSSSEMGFENPNFVEENDLDKSGRSAKVSNIPMTDMSTNSQDLYSAEQPEPPNQHTKKVNYAKKKNRMKRNTAAAIAAQRNRRTAPTHDDMDSLINNESVVVYDERTAL